MTRRPDFISWYSPNTAEPKSTRFAFWRLVDCARPGSFIPACGKQNRKIFPKLRLTKSRLTVESQNRRQSTGDRSELRLRYFTIRRCKSGVVTHNYNFVDCRVVIDSTSSKLIERQEYSKRYILRFTYVNNRERRRSDGIFD